MTREEARAIIKSECYIFDPLNLDRSTMVNTALDIAIKALEQESCDCISREEPIYKTGKWRKASRIKRWNKSHRNRSYHYFR